MGDHDLWVSLGFHPTNLQVWNAVLTRTPGRLTRYSPSCSEGVFAPLSLADWTWLCFNSEGAFLRARMTFPSDYPINPPELKFISSMWHPNIYSDGRVCISILHPPGDDPLNPYESAAERWSPVHTVESIVGSLPL